MYDPTPEHLAALDPTTSERAFTLVYAARLAGVPLIITSSRRSVAEQAALVDAGRSRTLQSLHITGRAFDVDVFGFQRDDVPRWWWDALGVYGESLGLRWGGRFRGFYDAGHFELGNQPPVVPQERV